MVHLYTFLYSAQVFTTVKYLVWKSFLEKAIKTKHVAFRRPCEFNYSYFVDLHSKLLQKVLFFIFLQHLNKCFFIKQVNYTKNCSCNTQLL